VNVLHGELPGIVLIEPRVSADTRGFFFESYRADRYAAIGLPPFVQDNHSCSVARTLRGLHYQLAHPQGKLVRVIRGKVLDVAVDIRRGSPTLGRWVAVELSAANKRQLYIPPGFAHGFCVPGEESEMEYKVTDYWAPADEHGIAWNSPLIGIQWPVSLPILSEKDQAFPAFDPNGPDLPEYRGE
jgi:dTDP-4-dehydrorhamnose 3,5-epimerase